MPFSASQAIESEITSLQSPTVRSQTVQALNLMERGNWSEAQSLISRTRDPMAAKLYYWLLFTQGPKDNWGNDQFVRLSQFIRQNPDWPSMKKLKEVAEQAMPSTLGEADTIGWFNDYPPETARGMDRYMAALLSTGQNEKAKTLLTEWWAVKPLGRVEQQDMFRKYFSLLDRRSHEKRFDALLFAGQYTNARAIGGVLQNGYPELAEARIALASDSGDVAARIQQVPRRLQEDPGLLYERLRWRRKNNLDIEAMEVLHRQPSMDQIQNPEDWWKERHIMIRRLLEQGSYRSAYLLAKEHEQTEGAPYAEAEWLAGWLALRFLGEPDQALQSFEAIYGKVKTSMSKCRAAYWAGRAAKELGQNERALQWFKVAAQNQTVYYGQLAASEISLGIALPAAPPPIITAQDKSAFEAREMVQAARLLEAAGMRDEASKFIHAFVQSDKTPKVYMYGAQLAAELKHFNDAIKISKEATNEGLFLTAQSFPLITERLRGVPTEWALVHSIIRQESMFDSGAQSPAGALGLMQVMPGTGKEVAQKNGWQSQTAWLLSNPDYNIKIGSAYLDQLLNRFGGSYVMAIAGYNAGPGRVNQWVEEFGDPRLGNIDMIDWIEMIPISETRNYVQRVLENVYVYRLRLKGKQAEPSHAIHIAMP